MYLNLSSISVASMILFTSFPLEFFLCINEVVSKIRQVQSLDKSKKKHRCVEDPDVPLTRGSICSVDRHPAAATVAADAQAMAAPWRRVLEQWGMGGGQNRGVA